MMAAAFFMTCSSDNLDGLVSLSIRAFFSASSFSRLRISSEDFSASDRAIFSINALALGTTVDSSSVAVIISSPPGRSQHRFNGKHHEFVLDSLAESLASLRLLVARPSRTGVVELIPPRTLSTPRLHQPEMPLAAHACHLLRHTCT